MEWRLIINRIEDRLIIKPLKKIDQRRNPIKHGRDQDTIDSSGIGRPWKT